jgi:hypothetical protein
MNHVQVARAIFVLVFFETISHYVVQTGLELYVSQARFKLAIPLPQSPQCWNYKCELPCLVANFTFKPNINENQNFLKNL